MSASSKILSGICVLVLCFVLLPTNIFAQASPAPAQKTITVTYDFPEPRVEETSEVPPAKGTFPLTEGYVSVTMEGLPQWSEPGLPVLPFRTARGLLPYGFDVERITVTRGNKVVLPGSYIVEPGQKAVPLSHEGPLELTPPSSDVYESSAPFPGKLYSGETIQSKSGYRILLVNLYPVEYIPQQGQLSYYESLTVEITLRAAAAEGEWQSVRHLAQDGDRVREMVDNPEIIKSYGTALPGSQESSLLPPVDYQYVIITSEALAATPGPNNFQALRNEKISRGIAATIVTTEWIYANYDGTRPDGAVDNQTKIRNFIIDAYNTWHTTYVLLGGDGDVADVGGESGDDIIPARGFSAGGDNDIAADMYYACLDGTFDYDANGIYGEPDDGPGGDEVDLFAEVYVGRAPVDSEAEVQNFVDKTLAYQSTPITDENLRKVWMVGEYLGFGGVADWGGNYKDEIKEGSSAHGYTTVGFEDSGYASGFDVSTLYDRDYPDNNWPASEIIGIINDNAHLINHLGHANVDYGMKMVNSDVDGLTNSELYFIGYSQGCYSGSFDNRDDQGSYTDYDCIAEHLTTQPHGAAAFIANSRYGFGAGGSTDGPSQHYDREFWDAVFNEDMLNIGVANQDSKEDNAGRVGDGIERWCYYEINLFGDPELTLKLQGGVSYEGHSIDDSAGGNGDGYPEPGESVSMPLALRNHSNDTQFLNVAATLTATTYATTPIFFEDFDGSWPGDWIVGDDEPTNGEDYWWQSNYRAYRDDSSAYCAEVSDIYGQYYDDYMSSFVVRDVDVSVYDSATLSYKYWLDCESGWDYLRVVYFDGTEYRSVKEYTGSSGGWVSDSIEVQPTATQVGFVFYSDGSITAEGAYIDDVALTGYSYVTDPSIHISDASEKYGSIPPGSVATSWGAYDFVVDPACPVGHVVRFNLNITASNGGPWTGKFDVRVGPPLEDLIRLTTDPNWDGEPAIMQADNGTVWVVWHSGRPGGNGLWYKTSADGRETWSADSSVDLGGMWGYQPAIAQTNDGKIWVTFRSDESGNDDIWYTTSSNNGTTWSAPSQITMDAESDYDPAITQTNDGKIWVIWYSHRSGNADIWYKTSVDGGTNWSADYQLTTDGDWDQTPAITEADDGTVWIVWESGRSGGNGLWCKTSPDGGETWSGDSSIDLGGMWGYNPAIAQTSDGRIWVTFCSWQSGNADTWYMTSSDGGLTWSNVSQFTRFVGADWEPIAAALANGQLALAWRSDRFSNYDIWYGVIDLMEDMNPPPHLNWAERDPCAPDNTQTLTIRAAVGDESGIEDVQLVWGVDGESQDMLPMFDDGAHNDYGAGDGVYGVQIGPFPVVGTVVDYQIQITDIDDNTVLAPQYPYTFQVVEPFVKTADILLVADEAYDYTQYYTEALDNSGYSYDVWETWHRCNVGVETLNQYLDGIVIWATPNFGYIGNSETWDNLSSYLDNGGRLFISGQDIGYYIGGSWFYQDYLHAQYVQDNIGLYCLDGVPGDPITDGLYVCISGGDGANNQAWPSEIDPISSAQTIFTYDPEATVPLSLAEEPTMAAEKTAPDKYRQQETAGTTATESTGSGALRVDTGVYRVVYFAFGFEAINSAADRATVMQRVITALNQLAVRTSELSPAAVGEEYEAMLKAVGGTQPYTWAIIDGNLPDGLGLDANTGVISDTPTTAGAFNFTVQVTDAAQDTATRELSISVVELSEFITDPAGDQFSGYGPDIVGADFGLDETTVYFGVRTAESIDLNDTVNYMLLDLDLDSSTGFVSDEPYLPTNDIGVDAVAAIYPAYLYGTMGEEWSLPLQRNNGDQQLQTESAQALSAGLRGELYIWDPYYQGFYYVGSFSVFSDTNYFACAIPLDMLNDDGIMSAVDIISNSSEPTDVAPNEGHGITGEGPELVIDNKWEQWVDEEAGTYTVSYLVWNKGNVAVPAGHEVALIVDGILLETKEVPVILGPAEGYADSFSTILTISALTDEITVCTDFYDVVGELSEENNCFTNALWTEPAWTEFITDPSGDQFSGHGPDIVGADFYVDDTTIYFRVRTAQPVDDPNDAVNADLMWLDLDLNAWTGYVSGNPYQPTNDMGADAAALVYLAPYGPQPPEPEERWSLPLQKTDGGRQLETKPAQAPPHGPMGALHLWDPDYKNFNYVGDFPVFIATDYFWLAIPLDMLGDDGIMSVVDVIAGYSEITDFAPNEGHGSTAPAVNPVRTLPDEVRPGDEFQVTVSFASPADNFVAIGLADVAPAGWSVSVDKTWCTPPADLDNNPTSEEADYIWFGPYVAGAGFTAVYTVLVPADATPGTYSFIDGTLEYYIGANGPCTEAITGDYEVEVEAALAKIVGETREVNCAILGNVTVTLYQDYVEITSTISDGDGDYELAVPELGDYVVVASKDGFRDKTQTISVTAPTTYTLDFVGNYGLIPNAPDMSYVLACINRWKFGTPPCQLNMSTVLAVINAWKFPI